MNQQFSRSQFPNGGWFYHDPRTGFSTPTPKSSTFDQAVNLIIKDRQKNPAAVIKHKLSLDPGTVGNELEAFTRRRLGIVSPLPSSPSILFPGTNVQLVSEVNEIKKIAMGTALLLAWERSGEPAEDQEVTNARAARCNACPLNNRTRLEEWSKSPVGSAVRSKTPKTQKMVNTPKGESSLGLCDGTFCPCVSLCSMPMSVIQRRTKPAEREQLHPACWIRA